MRQARVVERVLQNADHFVADPKAGSIENHRRSAEPANWFPRACLPMAPMSKLQNRAARSTHKRRPNCNAQSARTGLNFQTSPNRKRILLPEQPVLAVQ